MCVKIDIMVCFSVLIVLCLIRMLAAIVLQTVVISEFLR